jgi:threonine dehydrogenase-like Zn-dependent dehydrogenase
MLAEGRLPMERIVTHKLPLSDFKQGIDLVGEGTKSIKVTLSP